jgi:hypothetical protein
MLLTFKALQEKYPWFCINEPVKSDNESICSTKTGVSSSSRLLLNLHKEKLILKHHLKYLELTLTTPHKNGTLDHDNDRCLNSHLFSFLTIIQSL